MQLTSRILALGLASTLLAAAPSANGPTRPPEPGGVLIADGGLGGVLDIVEHAVHVTVHDGVAVTHVEQVFLNTEQRVVEALYLFPVPNGASVANFSMWIDGKEMVGEVLEKARARQIYDSYKQQKRDPGLLEQADFKTFEMRIFPIPAGARQKVSLTYYQELDFDKDWATYVYPLATSPRPGIVEHTTGKFAITFEVLSAAPIVQFDCPSHARDFVVVKHSPKFVEASLEATGGDLARDVVLAFRIDQPRTDVGVLTSKPDGEDGYFALTLTAGDELEQPERGTDYVFLLDISGSMADAGKLSLSRRSIDAFVDALAPEDRFEVMTFNVQPDKLFAELTAATPEARQRAIGFLASQQARGGTRLRPAMAAAYGYGDPDRVLNVVVLSDGMTEQQERNELMNLIGSRPSNARVFCIGVGNDVERPLLQHVAESAGGFVAFVSQQDDFERQAAAFRRKVAHPAARDVKLVFGGADVYDLEPKQLPDLFCGMPLRVYGRYRNGGPAKVTLAATVDGRDFQRDFDVDLPKVAGGDSRIERMWAWHRVQRLRHLSPVPTDEIVRLGEAYSIATEWTSFLVLENDAEYQRWQITRRNALRIARDRRLDTALQTELAAMRDKVVQGLGPQPPRDEAAPAPARPAVVPTTDAAPRPAPRPPVRDRSGGGMGAIDAWTGSLAAGLALLALLVLRRKGS
ncbi:MAG TPA: VIT and VWA domain-containing protein [Planctomycetota bacterium]|nr:VIT and VWA domain-containing protein [Planctomycetota bacterium]